MGDIGIASFMIGIFIHIFSFKWDEKSESAKINTKMLSVGTVTMTVGYILMIADLFISN